MLAQQQQSRQNVLLLIVAACVQILDLDCLISGVDLVCEMIFIIDLIPSACKVVIFAVPSDSS